ALPADTLSVTVALITPVAAEPSIRIPLLPLWYVSTRLNTAPTGPAPVGWTSIPLFALSATSVFDMTRWLAADGVNLTPLPMGNAPVRPRTAQFSTIKVAPLVNTIPLPPPKPIPFTVRPRRLTASLAPALIVMPATPPDTSTPASPTPSLMTLMALLIVTA